MKTILQRHYIYWFRGYGLSHPRMQMSYKSVGYTLGLFYLVVATEALLSRISTNHLFREILLLATIIGIGASYYYGFVNKAQSEFVRLRPKLTPLQRNLIKRDMKVLRLATYLFLFFIAVVALGVTTIVIGEAFH